MSEAEKLALVGAIGIFVVLMGASIVVSLFIELVLTIKCYVKRCKE